MASPKKRIGARPVRDLTASDVRKRLRALAPGSFRRSLQIMRNSLEQTISEAEANDLVRRNVASLVSLP